jgi:diadenosine tetraphosphatase ApaH/serine/threonine PP2A family protein phosphatase
VSVNSGISKEAILTDLVSVARDLGLTTRIANTSSGDVSDVVANLTAIDLLSDLVVFDAPPMDSEFGKTLALELARQTDSWLCCVVGELDDTFSKMLNQVRATKRLSDVNRQIVIASRMSDQSHWPEDSDVWIAGVLPEEELFASYARVEMVRNVLQVITTKFSVAVP